MKPNWNYIVLAPQGVTTFTDKGCAHRFALATHGTLYHASAVATYDGSNRRDHVGLHLDARPIEVD